jgi:hypothetical protein
MIKVSVGDPFCLHPLWNYSLMMEMKKVPETLEFNSKLTHV